MSRLFVSIFLILFLSQSLVYSVEHFPDDGGETQAPQERCEVSVISAHQLGSRVLNGLKLIWNNCIWRPSPEKKEKEGKKIIVHLMFVGTGSLLRSVYDHELPYSSAALEKKFPERPQHFIYAENREELKERLDSVLSEGDQISHLSIMAHGASYSDYTAIEIGSDSLRLKKENSYPQDLDVMNPFRSIYGRFTEDSQIYFYSCKILSGREEDALWKAERYRSLLGQENGTLYGNKTWGRQSFIHFNGIRFTLTRSGLQPLSMVSLPLSGYLFLQGMKTLRIGNYKLAATRATAGAVLDIGLAIYGWNSIKPLNVGYLCQVENGKIKSMIPVSGTQEAQRFYEFEEKRVPQLTSTEETFQVLEMFSGR